MIRGVQWTPGLTLEEMELQVIDVAYEHYRHNKSQTAAALGISVRNLDLKLEHIRETREKDIESAKERDQRDQDFLRRARGLPPLIIEKPEPQIAPKQPVPVRELEEIQEVSHAHKQQKRAAR